MKKINFILLLFVLSSTFTVVAEDKPYGGRTEKSVWTAFEPLTGPVYELFKKELEVNSKFKGRADFSIQILSTGKVKACSAEVTDSFVEELADKICVLIKDMDFGEGEEFVLSYPINFYPEKP